ncbi:hypothetical protein OY671_011947, partial [Metschnikowia pulcherrima]
VSAVRLPAHEHGRLHRAIARRRRDQGAARDPCPRADRGWHRRCRHDRAAATAGRRPVRRDGRQRGGDARGKARFRHPHLGGAAGARQLRRAWSADRAGPRHAGALGAGRHQHHQHGRDDPPGAGRRSRHCGCGDRRRDRGSRGPRHRRRDRTAADR